MPVVPTIKPLYHDKRQCKKRPIDYIGVFIYPYGKVMRPFCKYIDFTIEVTL